MPEAARRWSTAPRCTCGSARQVTAREACNSLGAMARAPLAAALLALLAPAALRAQMAEARDRVTLLDGKELRGRVMRFDANELILRVGSVDRTIPRKQVRAF